MSDSTCGTARDHHDRRDRARGSLLGLACGDALGRPVAGATGAAVRDRHGRVREMLSADGRPAGTTTDCTAAATTAGHRLLAERGESLPTGIDAEVPPASEQGAGAVLAGGVPVGLLAAESDRHAEVAVAETRQDGDDSPLAAEALESRAVLAVVVGALVAGDPMGRALEAAREVAVARGAPVALRETLAVVGDPAAVTIETSGDVVGTLETGLHEAVVADGPDEAVVSAVSRGGHATGLGAVAGAVAGAAAGEDAVPARWLNELDCVGALRSLADALAETSLAIE